MASNSQSRSLPEKVATGKLLRAGIIAALGAVIVNSLIFVFTTGVFKLNIVLPTDGSALSLPPIIFTSVLGVVGAGVVYYALGRFTSRPVTIFWIVGVVFLIVSFLPNLFASINTESKLTLSLMHVVVAAFSLVLFTTVAREK